MTGACVALERRINRAKAIVRRVVPPWSEDEELAIISLGNIVSLMCPPLNIDQLIKASASLEMEKIVQEQARAAEEAIRVFRDQFRPLLESIEEVVRPFQKSLEENSHKWMALVETASEAWETHRRFEQALKESHIKDKVSMPPYVLGMYADEVMALFEDPRRPPLEAYEEVFSSAEHLAPILAKWSENPIYEERMEILRAALVAHQRKDYVLAIPTMLAQIDGILQGSLSVEKHSRFEGKIRKTIPSRDEDRKFNDEVYGKKVFLEAIVDEVFKDSKRSPGIYPNRHAVLHGRDLSYFKERYASLRCVLILDFLSVTKESFLQ